MRNYAEIQQTIKQLFLGCAPERRKELEALWDTYRPEFQIHDDNHEDGPFIFDAGAYRAIQAEVQARGRRPDPLVEVTEDLRTWFDAEPWRTARELLAKLQAEQPCGYPENLLRTLQRPRKIWRAERAHEMVFGSPCRDAPAIEAAERT